MYFNKYAFYSKYSYLKKNVHGPSVKSSGGNSTQILSFSKSTNPKTLHYSSIIRIQVKVQKYYEQNVVIKSKSTRSKEI